MMQIQLAHLSHVCPFCRGTVSDFVALKAVTNNGVTVVVGVESCPAPACLRKAYIASQAQLVLMGIDPTPKKDSPILKPGEEWKG